MMKRYLVLAILLFVTKTEVSAQSFELMPGLEKLFVDVQWLETFDNTNQWSLFSRTRATVDHNENTDLFTGAYLNYSFHSRFGATVIGRISSSGVGGDLGVHYFKVKESAMIYALTSVELDSEFVYSWFSIMRYTPRLSTEWKLYCSLELFSNFKSNEHIVSVQRIRMGLDRYGYQFGVALNLSGIGEYYDNIYSNPGVFLRKQF